MSGTPTQDLLPRDKPPEHQALKASGAHDHETQRAIVNWKTALKGLVHTGAQHRGGRYKSTQTLCEDLFADL